MGDPASHEAREHAKRTGRLLDHVLAELGHGRSSLRLGNTAEVWCRCGWRMEFRAFSGDAASARIIAEWENHMASIAADLLREGDDGAWIDGEVSLWGVRDV